MTRAGERRELDLSPLLASVGFLVRLAQQRLFEEFNGHFAAEGLTPARYSLLLLLEANPQARQAEIGAALSIKQPNLVVLVNALEADGLIARRTDGADRRSNRLALTPAGRALLRRTRPAMTSMEAMVRDRLGPELGDAAVEGLKRLAGV